MRGDLKVQLPDLSALTTMGQVVFLTMDEAQHWQSSHLSPLLLLPAQPLTVPAELKKHGETAVPRNSHKGEEICYNPGSGKLQKHLRDQVLAKANSAFFLPCSFPVPHLSSCSSLWQLSLPMAGG